MERKTGIWLDRKKAYLVHLEDGKETLEKIESDVEFQERIPGQTDRRGRLRFRGATGGVEIATEEKSQEKRNAKFLQDYYQEIAQHLKNSMAVYIFGPAEAKIEFEKELKKDNAIAPHIAAVETADSMTENQIKAHVREYFSSN